MKVNVTFEFDSVEEAAAALAAGGIAPPIPPDTTEEAPEKPAKTVKKKAAKKTKPPAKKTDTASGEGEEEGEITIVELRALFQQVVKAGKRDEALALLKKYKVAKIHDVGEEDMEAMYADAKALLDGGDDDDDDDDMF